MSWQNFVEAVAHANFEFSWQRPLIIAQAILESGRGTSDLSFHKNMNGMKYRPSIAIPGSEKFQYYTDSERDNPDHPGWDWFFKFDNYETGIKVWQKFFFRQDGDWIPYPKVYERDPAVLKDAHSFLDYIGPIYCPSFKASHGESYADYIMNRCFAEAQQLLQSVGTSRKASRTFKVAIMPGHGGSDSGAYNQPQKVGESEYNWLEAQEIKRLLEQDGNYQVTICREKSEDLALQEFQGRANSTDADICLCLHHNSVDNPGTKGWWLFSSKEDAKTNRFIQIMDRHFRELPLQARGCLTVIPPFSTGDWKKRVWNCIHACEMPTILFESCFISNDQDCHWLKNGGYKQVAQKICDGVREYLQGLTQSYSVLANNSNSLPVRSGPGTTHSVITQLQNGTVLTVISDNGQGWLQISAPISGWVPKSQTKNLSSPSPVLYRAEVKDSDPPLNVRSGPGTTHPTVGTLNNGTPIEVVEDNQTGWLRITNPLEGWVAKHLTKRTDTTQKRLLHLVRTDKQDDRGCKWLILSIVHEGNFNPIESINAVSGVPSCQVFEKGGTGEQPGTCRPLPQGSYSVGSVAWAGGKGNYNASFGAGLGPVWVPVEPLFPTDRDDFGIHLDANRINRPGTAGCIGFTTVEELKRFVAWFDDPDNAPQGLTVDWGL
jgi:N-acetylmuramoyl-L-alanine amidase/uncharacterized protein YgiM (DUF1202 family)